MMRGLLRERREGRAAGAAARAAVRRATTEIGGRIVDHEARYAAAQVAGSSAMHAAATTRELAAMLGGGDEYRRQTVLGLIDVCVNHAGETFQELAAAGLLPLVLRLARGRAPAAWPWARARARADRDRDRARDTKLLAQQLVRMWAEGLGQMEDWGAEYAAAYRQLQEEGVDFDCPRGRELARRGSPPPPPALRGNSASRGAHLDMVADAAPGRGERFTYSSVLQDIRGLVVLFAEQLPKIDPQKEDLRRNELLNGLCALVFNARHRIKYMAEHSNTDHVIQTAVELDQKAQDAISTFNQLVESATIHASRVEIE